MLASANINQSAPHLVTIYMTIRFRMSSIMVKIGPEHPQLFAIELEKIAEFDFVYTLASTNINKNEYNYKISDEFDYGCNQTRTVQVICP